MLRYKGKSMEMQPQAVKKEYRISRVESERIQMLKLWFSIMVVLIHSYDVKLNFASGTIMLNGPFWLDQVQYFISEVICRCAVPGYFVLSSIFLYRKEFTWGTNMRKKVRSLVVPYVLLHMVWITICYIGQHIDALRVYFSQPANIVSGWGLWGWINAFLGVYRTYPGDCLPFVGQLWFLRDLFVLNALAILIRKVIGRAPRLTALGLIILCIFNIKTHILFPSRDALVFFCLGYYFVKYDLHLRDIDKLNPVLLA